MKKSYLLKVGNCIKSILTFYNEKKSVYSFLITSKQYVGCVPSLSRRIAKQIQLSPKLLGKLNKIKHEPRQFVKNMHHLNVLLKY